jgi:hypothetical protein
VAIAIDRSIGQFIVVNFASIAKIGYDGIALAAIEAAQ